jgi:hypothetical protein
MKLSINLLKITDPYGSPAADFTQPTSNRVILKNLAEIGKLEGEKESLDENKG